MRDAIKNLVRPVFRRLPPHAQDGLRTIKAGTAMLLRGGSAAIARPLVRNIDIEALLKTFVFPSHLAPVLRAYDECADAALRQEATLSLFFRVSLNPAPYRLLDNAYCVKRFAGHPLYEQMLSAYLHGTGRRDEAFARLDALARQTPTAFNALLAARCLLRPPGREADAIRYLTTALASFPGDLAISANLAAAIFASGDVTAANRILAPVVPLLKRAAEPYRKELDSLSAELANALRSGTVERVSPYDRSYYLEENIEAYWEPYFADMVTQPPSLMYGWLNGFYRDRLVEAAGGEERLDTMVNFGVMCAQADYEAARALPGTKFVGVDRQAQTAKLNRFAYDVPNLEFSVGEIETVLPQLVSGRTGMFHARTATLLYPQRLRNLYKQCAELGVKKILVFENMSISHEHYRFFGFDDMPESMICKNWQFIHNYRRFLEEANYKVVKQLVLPSPLITPDSTMDLGLTHVFLSAELVEGAQ